MVASVRYLSDARYITAKLRNRMREKPLRVILTEKSLIIKSFSLNISHKQNQDTEVNWKIRL